VQRVRPDWMRQFDWQGKQAAPILGKHPTQGGRQLALIGGGALELVRRDGQVEECRRKRI